MTTLPQLGVVTAPASAHKSRSLLALALRDLWRHPLGRLGGLLVLLLVLAAICAPWLAPYDPAGINYESILVPPDAGHWFGTDEIGRDILSRVLYGARVSLQVVGVAIGGAMVIGSAIGLVSGFLGGAADALIMRIMDGLLAFPMLVLALAIVAVLGPDLINATIAIAIVNIPGFARLVRGEVLVVRELEYVLAARAIGASPLRLMALHVWPNVSGNVIVYASLKASSALITESALSFLGLGVQPPTPSWGQMVATGMDYFQAWWMSFFPGLAIFLTVLALNFLGDGLRDVLDPRLKSGGH
jgi:peptide/nickel transport system permease protein